MSWEIQKPPEKQKQILVGIAHRGSFASRWVAGLLSTHWPNPPYYNFQSGQPIDIARNIMVSKAMEYKCEHLFFLDDDVVLRDDTLNRLASVHMPIVSGVYRSRAEPYSIVAQIGGYPINMTHVEKDKVMEVEEVGMGCCLIDTRVFHRIARSLNLDFYCMRNHKYDVKQETVVYTYHEAVHQGMKCKYCGGLVVAKFFDYRLGKQRVNPLSEDYFFCHQARQVGFPIFIRMDTIVDHIIGGNVLVNEDGLVNRNTTAEQLT